MRFLPAITLLAAISPWASAQRMSGFSPHPGVPAAPGFTGNGFMGNGFTGNGFGGRGFAGNGFGRSGFAHGNHRFPGGFAVPFFTDALYSDLLATGYPAGSQPPVIVMQEPPTAPVAAAAFPGPEPPLMIELQGDRYVQVSGEAKSAAQMQTIDGASVTASAAKLAKPASGQLIRASEKQTMLATLVFRDGHREEISDYTITNGVVYAKADYYNSGSWNRKIELSSLNLPETAQINESHGLRFQLPSSPNEVIVGP